MARKLKIIENEKHPLYHFKYVYISDKYYNNEMIDYDIVTNKINKFREFSRQWLLGKLDYENNKK